MKPRRRKEAPAPAPVSPRPDPPTPEWALAWKRTCDRKGAGDEVWVSPTVTHAVDLAGRTFHVPAYQRGPVWSADRQAAYVQSLWEGAVGAPMVLWETWTRADGKRIWVLDGQQRLTAIGATIIREDGDPQPPTAAHLDLDAGVWRPVPDRWGSTVAQIATWYPAGVDRSEVRVDGSDAGQAQWAYTYAASRLLDAKVVVYRIDGSDPVKVARLYRTINIPGVPHTEEDMRRFERWMEASCTP